MIKNIIFDIGGVITNINYQALDDAFKRLGGRSLIDVYAQKQQTKVFDQFETGKINSAEFRHEVKSLLLLEQINDQQFDSAWNNIFAGIPRERLLFLKQLKEQGYQIILFSNINEIHAQDLNDYLTSNNLLDDFNACYDKLYYSYRFGMRKPNPEAFTKILLENNLQANETLFIDDSIQHVEGARKAGLHAVYLDQEKTIFQVPEWISDLA